MADAQPRPMHTDFARWYATVGIGDHAAARDARWTGVSAIVQNADRGDVEALTRLAFRSRQAPDADTVQALREQFKAADEAFEMNGNDRELEVLSGATLVAIMEDTADHDIAAAAALSVTTASMGGARKSPLPMDLAPFAEHALKRIADANRKRPSLSALASAKTPAVNFEAAVKKLTEAENWEGARHAFPLAAQATQAAITTLAQQQTALVQRVDQFLRAQDEELQMLWWLTGERSWDCDCAFVAVAPATRPLVFAKELADHTEMLPGPPSISALLARAGVDDAAGIKLAPTINAADGSWLRALIGSADPSPVSCPIHFAIKRQLETGAGEAWVAGWAAVTEINPDHTLTPLALANLFYRERLLTLFG